MSRCRATARKLTLQSWKVKCLFSMVVCVIVAGNGHLAAAGDWPQILGPIRNGVAEGEQLADAWPANGPQILWSQALGQGTAGVAVMGQTLVAFHRPGDIEVVEAMNPATGETHWKKSYPTTFVSQVGGDDGPLCVPTIVGERVISFGPQGVLCCWAIQDGKLHWRRNTHEDFNAREGYFGAGSSPLVVGDRVIVNVGGAKAGAGVVAFDLASGNDVWSATDERASYSAPMATTVGGRDVVLCVARLNCVGLDPSNGAVLFEVPFGRRGPTVNAATPVVVDGQFILTASYGIGAYFGQLTSEGVTELWRKSDLLSSQYTTPIVYKGALYGIDGRDDIPPAHLRCIDVKEGQVRWSEDNFGYATLIRSEDELLIVKTDGELVLARANPDRFEPLARHHLTQRTLRALPALSNGRLFVRDDQTLYCLQVGRR